MDFAQSLQALREARGLSISTLSDLSGIDANSLRAFENGGAAPSAGAVLALADTFGVTPDALLNAGEVETGYGNVSLSAPEIEYKSRAKIGKLPLIHICLGAKPRTAKGVIAIGNYAVGVIAIGAVSFGVISIGAISAGVFALGGIAAGALALGGVAVGYVAVGAAAFGAYAFGAVAFAVQAAMGAFAFGPHSMGANLSAELCTAKGVTPLQTAQFMNTYLPQFIKDFIGFRL